MRASFPAQALASLFAAAALGTLSPGCSLGVEAPLLEEDSAPLPPPLLELETPCADLVYSAADDEEPNVPGVQLHLRVRVNDVENGVWLEDVALGTEGNVQRATVHEDWRGQRSAQLPITVLPGDEPTTVTLVARAGEGLEKLEQRIVVGPGRP